MKELTIEDMWAWADDLCDKWDSLSKEEWKKEHKKYINHCCGGYSGREIYFITHSRLEKLLGPPLIETIDEESGNIKLF